MMAEEGEDSGALAGFAAMLAMCAAPDRPILWLRTETAERQAGRIYATGLTELGVPGQALLFALAADEAMLLRTAADAARCAGLGTLVVEAWGAAKLIDLTATRRLMLAAEHSGVTVLLVRGAARESPSVADTRWRVASAPSSALPTEAPGQPAFDLELLRRRAGPAGRQWRVEWNRERRSFQIPGSGTTALPGAVFPVAAH
jgi:protein ImuA